MKKLFALALIGFMVAFTSNATASDFNNTDVVISIAHYDLPTFAVALEVESATTVFVNNVANENVNYIERDILSIAVNTVGSFNKSYVTSNNSFADIPIDYGIRSNRFDTNKANKQYVKYSTNGFYTNKPLPYLTNLNKTNGYANPEFLKGIATNVGKLLLNI